MTNDEIKTKINEIQNNMIPGNKTEESACDINCSYSDYVTEDESNDIRVEFLENNRGENTEGKNIQLISRLTYPQVSERDQPSKIHTIKSNKHTVQHCTYSIALQTLNGQTNGKYHRSMSYTQLH